MCVSLIGNITKRMFRKGGTAVTVWVKDWKSFLCNLNTYIHTCMKAVPEGNTQVLVFSAPELWGPSSSHALMESQEV